MDSGGCAGAGAGGVVMEAPTTARAQVVSPREVSAIDANTDKVKATHDAARSGRAAGWEKIAQGEQVDTQILQERAAGTRVGAMCWGLRSAERDCVRK